MPRPLGCLAEDEATGVTGMPGVLGEGRDGVFKTQLRAGSFGTS